jgi:diadenosine tetraphosphate (Ap4A) HIT family hydrolase
MNTNHQPDCPFCHIDKIVGAVGVAIRPIVYKFEPLNPVVPGHRLFIPRAHIANAGESPITAGAVFSAASAYAHKVGGDYNLITSRGRSATQSVFHLHIHYVPREEGDGLSLPWTEQTVMQCIDDLCTYWDGLTKGESPTSKQVRDARKGIRSWERK